MAQIDWGLLQTPDYVGNALKYQQAGQQQAEVDTRRNALSQYSSDPQGAINSLMPVDPQTAVALQGQQAKQAQLATRKAAIGKYGNGDVAGAQQDLLSSGDTETLSALSKLSEEQKAQAKERATTFANIGYGLLQQPYEQRKAALAQLAQNAATLGLKPEDVANFDPTDGNIHAVLSQSLGLAKMIDLAKPVEMDPSKNYIQSDLIGGGGAAAPTAAGPTPSAPAPSGGIYDQVAQYAAKNGAKPAETSYLQRLAQVESSGNPSAQNGSSTGVFQFHPATFKELGGRDLSDVGQQTYAALQLQRRDRQALQSMGVDPTDANAYIMHQQGAGGGRALLTADPNANAVSVLTPVYGNPDLARKAITGNGGAADMTAGDFVKMWRQKWSAQPSPAGQRSTPDSSAAQPQAGAPAGYHVVQQAQQTWKPDGKGSLVNQITGDRKADTSFDDGSGAGLDDSTVKLLAGRYLKDGSLPPLGMGKAAAGARQKILNQAASMASDLGLNANDLVAGTADVKATAAALSKQTQQLSAVKSFENTAIKNADLALSLAPKGAGPTNAPVVNRWLQAGRQNVQGDPAVTQFNIALGTFSDEYAKIVTGSTGGQGSTDAARKEAYDRLSKYATKGQLAAGVATMKQEMANRVSSMEDVNQGLRSHLSGSPGASSAPTSPSGEPPVMSPQQAAQLPKGTRFRTTDGRVLVRQ